MGEPYQYGDSNTSPEEILTMRFVSRILIGVAAATVVAVGAPVAANATTSSASATTTASSSYEADWGAYPSHDHKAEAQGHVSVDKKPYKHWYWKKFKVQKKHCWYDKKGNKHCKTVTKWVKKRVFEWRHHEFFKVDVKLTNHKWWGKNKCAWATFKVVNQDGSKYFESFRNCTRHPKFFSFSGKNAAHIFVDVSRGNRHHPTGHHSGWRDVYHAAA
ncbi:hypothetical protein HII36_16720 [Nonomuraea sp. NN258]|uniref:hypothetical protein n=1 Tax=Nonomuraea antri TaxID=2730852 RepID=UPI001568B7F6|nr:hypothetical protein [Nonomuraea antri]NRQ33479.1 hypothetical protein [Nonomuraea antri]